ncbi:hypothetical protein GCM10009081_06760 [Brevundimonas nasdae]
MWLISQIVIPGLSEAMNPEPRATVAPLKRIPPPDESLLGSGFALRTPRNDACGTKLDWL